MPHATPVLLVAAAMMLSPIAMHAQSTLYKVVDQYGNVTYQDTPPDDSVGVSAETLEVEAPAPEVPPPAPNGNRDNILAATTTRPLVLFSVPNCDACDFLRWFLEERELPFEEVNVERDIDNQRRLRDATGEYRVPVLMVGETPMFGYDREDLVAELADAGYIAPDSVADASESGDQVDSEEPIDTDRGEQEATEAAQQDGSGSSNAQ